MLEMLQPRTGVQLVRSAYNGHIGTCSLFAIVSDKHNAEHAIVVILHGIHETLLVEFADKMLGTLVGNGAGHDNTIALHFG